MTYVTAVEYTKATPKLTVYYVDHNEDIINLTKDKDKAARFDGEYAALTKWAEALRRMFKEEKAIRVTLIEIEPPSAISEADLSEIFTLAPVTSHGEVCPECGENCGEDDYEPGCAAGCKMRPHEDDSTKFTCDGCGHTERFNEDGSVTCSNPRFSPGEEWPKPKSYTEQLLKEHGIEYTIKPKRSKDNEQA